MKNIVITSKPGVGKTTLIKEVTGLYADKVGGFYTSEIRKAKEGEKTTERAGFVMDSFSGERGMLAYKGMQSRYRLNKYGIDINVIENIGVKAMLGALAEKKVIVIDEIGSMEIISQKFMDAVALCFNSVKNVLATIRYNSQPFTDEVKKFSDTKIIFLTRENYGDVKGEVKQWMEKI